MSLILLAVLSLAVSAPAEPVALRIMTFNLWIGGEAGKQPLDQTVRVIRMARADVVGLQETGGHERNGARPDNSKKIAVQLGWSHVDQGGGRAIISRHPIVEPTPQRWGAKIALAGGGFAFVFNAHLAHAPYQPYQLFRIPYHDGPFIKTAEEAVRFARAARGGEVESLVAEMKPALSSELPVFLTGDLNEPSHLDWNEAAAKAGKCPLAVQWPATKAISDAGLADALRIVRPDPVQDPAHTWTPTTRLDDPKDRHDRIDFVFFAGPAKPTSVEIVGEADGRAQIVVTPYPSDHRAVVARFEISPPRASPPAAPGSPPGK